MSDQNSGADRTDTPGTPRRAGSAELEEQREPLKQHGDALRDGSGNRHGEHERGERPDSGA